MFENFKKEKSILLSSYPKSGNTWLKFILSNLYAIKGTFISFKNIEEIAPGVMPMWKYFFKKKYLYPSVFKSHSPYQFSNNKFKNIYLIRDPRDVYISYYYFLGGAKDLKHFSWFIANYEFPYGRWSEHVRSWIQHRNEDNVAIVKYEDLLVNIHHELDRIVDKLSLPSTKQERNEAVEKCTFNNLKKMASKAGNNYFFRKGTSSQWVNTYSDEARDQFCKFEDIGLLQELNYTAF
jgi:estrone sulfotransferase